MVFVDGVLQSISSILLYFEFIFYHTANFLYAFQNAYFVTFFSTLLWNSFQNTCENIFNPPFSLRQVFGSGIEYEINTKLLPIVILQSFILPVTVFYYLVIFNEFMKLKRNNHRCTFMHAENKFKISTYLE